MFKNLIFFIRLKLCGDPRKTAELWRKRGIRLGEGCHVYGRVSFGSEPYLIDFGNNVRITKGVEFITHDGGVWTLRKMKLLENADIFGPIKVGNNVHIGINTIVMPNVCIGNNVIIGAGSIVTKDIPDNSVAAGVPARVIRTIEEYYDKYKDKVDYTKHMNPEEKKKYLYKKYGLE